MDDWRNQWTYGSHFSEAWEERESGDMLLAEMN